MSYKLFAGNNYYPLGGYDDFKGNFDSIEEAMRGFITYYEDGSGAEYAEQWGHIVCDDKIIFKVENEMHITETSISYSYTWESVDS